MGNEQTEHRPSKRKAGWLGPGVLIGLLGIMALIQFTADQTDHQFSNIATGILGLVFIGTLLLWWVRFFEGSLLVWLLPFGLLIAIGFGVMLFEFTSFSGELVPQFRYRFAAAPDLRTTPELFPSEVVEQTTLELNEKSFPGFLGPERSGYVAPRLFNDDWMASPPELIWKEAIGAGLAGFATAELVRPGDEVTPIGITLEQRGEYEAITCYDLNNGELLWMHQHKAYHTHPLGDSGPRSTPMIAPNGFVYALGATGHVWCVNAVDGQLVWQKELFKLAGIDKASAEAAVTWGRSASPLLVDDFVVVPMGGSSGNSSGADRTLVALDTATGEPKWFGGTYQVSYASPVLVSLSGRRQIVSVNQDFVSGHDPLSGQQLWSSEWRGESTGGANCSNPTLVDDDKILLSKGYGGGAKLLQVTNRDGKFVAEELWRESRVLKTKFTNPVVFERYVYGLSDGTLECVSLEDGESQWKQPRSSRFGHGHILIVEDVILATTEVGEVVLVELNPNKYVELGRFQAIEGKTWNPMALWGSKVLVRNGFEMALWELGPRRDSPESQAGEETNVPDAPK